MKKLCICMMTIILFFNKTHGMVPDKKNNNVIASLSVNSVITPATQANEQLINQAHKFVQYNFPDPDLKKRATLITTHAKTLVPPLAMLCAQYAQEFIKDDDLLVTIRLSKKNKAKKCRLFELLYPLRLLHRLQKNIAQPY